MQTITALAIDSREGLILLEMATEDGNLTDAATFINLIKELPDIVIVSSGVILREGEVKLSKLIHDDRFSSMKLLLILESKP